MSLDPETLALQHELLAAHRRTLAHLLQQAAQFGGEVFAPPQTANGIAEARSEIARSKEALRAAGVQVEDEPDDEAPPARSPAETEAERKKFEEQRAQDAALATYISEMESLIINNNLRHSWPDAGVRRVARMRTLTAIRRLDGNHNQKLFQFLHEMGLLAPPDRSRPSLGIVNMPILDMSGANLQGADLERVNLRRAYLKGANLQRANLRGADLGEANLEGAKLVETNLEGANLQGVNLLWAYLQEAKLRRAKLEGAYLKWANLRSHYARRLEAPIAPPKAFQSDHNDECNNRLAMTPKRSPYLRIMAVIVGSTERQGKAIWHSNTSVYRSCDDF